MTESALAKPDADDTDDVEREAADDAVDVPSVTVQTDSRVATLAAAGAGWRVRVAMKSRVAGPVIDIFSAEFDELDAAVDRLRHLTESWGATFVPQELTESHPVSPAIVGRGDDGESLTVVYFGEDRWIGFDSLDPDGVYADWTSYGAALDEVIDVVCDP